MLPTCPRCHTPLVRGRTTLVFRYAPVATQAQTVEAWVCPCGESYVPGTIARAAFRRAFQHADADDNPKLEPLRQTMLCWAGTGDGLPADLASKGKSK